MPRVSVRNSVRKPIRPRAGTTCSMRIQPVPWFTRFSMRPLRSARSCVTTPRYSSGASIATRSIGSWSVPPIVRVTTWGLPTVSSKPSRRITSTSTASWSSPRPCTSQRSGRSAGRTRIETLPTTSWSSRSFTARAVTFVPSSPASGDVLMPIVIDNEGSSTRVTGSGRGSSGSTRLSPIVTSSSPETATISPGPASSTATRSRASLTDSSPIFAGSIVPSARHHATAWPRRIVPLRTRQSASRPRYGEASRFATRAWSGWPSS